MKIWLLKRINWRESAYDCCNGFVIDAESSLEARKMANAQSADEGNIWEDEDKCTCECIGESSFEKAYTVLINFRHG
jgi:hypothetical protein